MVKHILKILALLIGGGILTLFGLYLLLLKTPLLREGVNLLVKMDSFPFEVKVEKIEGNLFSQIKIEGIKGKIHLPGFPPSLLQIKEIQLRYSILNLLHREKVVKEIILQEPQLILKTAKRNIHQSSGEDDPILPSFLFQGVSMKDGSLTLEGITSTLHFQSINFDLPSISLRNEKIEGEIEDLSFDLVEKDFHLRTLRGKFTFQNDSLLLSGINIVTSRSNLLISGSISTLSDPEISFDITGNKLNLNEIDGIGNLGGVLSGTVKTSITAHGRLRNFQGEAVIDGIFLGNRMEEFTTKYRWNDNTLYLQGAEGIYFKAQMNGSGWLNFSTSPPTYFANLRLSGLNINEVVKSPITTDLNGKVKLEGKGFTLDDLSMDFLVDLRESRIQGIVVDTIRGGIFVDRTEIVFFPGFETHLKGTYTLWEGNIGFRGETKMSGQISSPDLSFLDEIFPLPGWEGRPVVDFELRGDIKNPDLIANLTIDCLRNNLLSIQRLAGEFELYRILSQRQGKAWLRGDSLEVKGFKFKTSSVHLDFKESSIYLDSLRVEGEDLSLAGKGSFLKERAKGTLCMKEITGQYRGTGFSSQGPFEAIFLEDMISFGEVKLKTEEGAILCSGTWEATKGLKLSLRAEDLKIRPILGNLLPQIDGYCTVNLDLSLASAQPSFSGSFEIKNGRWRRLKFESVSSPIRYKNGVLSVEGLECRIGDSKYHLWATIPLLFLLQPPGLKLLDERLEFTLEGRGNSFTLPLLWTDLLEESKGNFTLWGQVEGTPSKPASSGELKIESGELKIKGIKNRFTGFNLDLALEENILTINRMEVQSSGEERGEARNIFYQLWRTLSGRKKSEVGHLEASGYIDVSQLKLPGFNLKMEARRFPILLSEGKTEAIFDGSLQLIGQRPPLLQGRVLVHKLVYQLPTSWSPPEEKRGLPFSLGLELSFPQNLWIKNPQASIELEGELRLSSVQDRIGVLGELGLRRGEYFLYGSTFHINSGLIDFEESSELNPRIEIEGKTEVGDETIILMVKGTLKEPIISLDSSPHHYPQDDILALLAVHQTPTGIDTLGAGRSIAPRAKDFFTSYLEHELEREIAKSLQVETLQLRTNREKELDLAKMEITVGKYISNRIYLQYSRRLSMGSGQEVGIDYRLSRFFYLEGLRDRKGLYRLSLNLKWNY